VQLMPLWRTLQRAAAGFSRQSGRRAFSGGDGELKFAAAGGFSRRTTG